MAQVPATSYESTSLGDVAEFTIPFPFLSRAEVFVTVDGASVPFTWINDGLVQLTTVPELGAVVRRYRSTAAYVPLHQFSTGVPFLPRYVDRDFKQTLYAVQESVNDTAGTAAQALATAEESLLLVQDAFDILSERTQYIVLGAYGPGLNFQTTSQVFRYLGELYAPGPGITLPYVTTGVGAPEIANFRSVGDAVLRTDLAMTTGASLIGYKATTLANKLSHTISPAEYGAVGGGADDTVALTAMFAAAVALPAAIVDFTGKTYRYTANIVVNGSVHVMGNCTFHGDNAYITVQGSLSAVGNIAAAAAFGDDQFTASAVAGLARNDLLILQNAIAGSFSPHRPEYYDGEFIRVAAVVGSVVHTQSNFVTAYAGVVTDKIYKINPITVVLEGVSFTGGNTYALRIKYADGGRIACKSIKNTLGTAAAGSALAIDRSYGVLVQGGKFDLPYFAGAGLSYGINVINSEYVRISGVDAFGGRHAVTTGGDNELGAAPCRNIVIADSVLRNDPASGVYCADFHGNTADSVYRNCVIYGRIGLAGENVSAVDCEVWSEPGTVQSPLGYHELVGGDLQFINCKVFLGAGAAPTSIVSNLSSSLTANISRPYKVIVRGLNAALRAAVTTVVNAYDNSGQPSSWTLDDFEVRGDTAGLTSFLSYTKAGAGIEPLVVETTNPRFPVSASFTPIVKSGATFASTHLGAYAVSGSTATGKFRKSADGSMVCTHKLTSPATAIDTAFLGGFRSGGVVWTLPATFAAEPEVVGTPTNASAMGIVESTASASSCTFFFTANASQVAGTRDVRLVATGRWL